MSVYGYWNSWGQGKNNKYDSVSGWERSHFGGYTRVLSDYPHIKVDFELSIKQDASISSDLGVWMGEKLIKLYVLKIKELGFIDYLKTEIIEKPSFFGMPKKYIVASLAHDDIFFKICNSYSELAPMFENYKEGIFGSYIEMEFKDEGENGEGQGEGEENSEKQDNEEGEGQGKGEENSEKQDKKEGEGKGEREGSGAPKNKGKTIQQWMKRISESKPFTYTGSLSRFEQVPKFVSFTSRIKKQETKPYRFKPEEIKDAEALIKLLDISFDPTSAEIKNLKLGKLDVSKIAEVPAGNISVYKQTVEEQDTKPFSVCILADMSGSMGQGNRIPSQLHIMNSLYLAMSQILPPDKLYIYGHSGEYQPEIYSFYTPHDIDYERNIRFYRDGVHWCQNYDGPVIESIHKKIRENSDDRIIFISLSDGEPAGNNYGGKEDNEELKRILERARRDSFVTVGIGIEAGHVAQLYTYAKPVWDLTQLPKEVSGIINQVVRSEFK